MSTRKKIKDRIKRKELEIQQLEAKIREEKAYIQALQDAIKLLPRDDDIPAEAKLRPGSAVGKAREVILKAGRPLHISKILEAMGRSADRKGQTGLSGSIHSYVRRGEIFTRPAPNTFGLVEMGNKTEKNKVAVPPTDDDLPPDFGVDDETPF